MSDEDIIHSIVGIVYGFVRKQILCQRTILDNIRVNQACCLNAYRILVPNIKLRFSGCIARKSSDLCEKKILPATT